MGRHLLGGVIAASLCLPTTSLAAEYAVLKVLPDRLILADWNSIKKQPSGAVVYTLATFFKQPTTVGRFTVDYRKDITEFSCSDSKMRVLRVVGYAAPDRRLVDYSEPAPTWDPVAPATLGLKEWKIACGRLAKTELQILNFADLELLSKLRQP